MTGLKLKAILNEKPVKITIELPGSIHRDLVAYAEMFAGETGQVTPELASLIGPMVARFMASDRTFGKLRRAKTVSE